MLFFSNHVDFTFPIFDETKLPITTGCFWSAGLSMGYRFSLTGGLGMGLGIRAGYRSVFDGKKYRYDAPDDRNYLETRFASTGFMLGLRISLSYRFQIR